MDSQGCRELFERPVAVSLAEKVEPERRQALFIEEASQGLVGCTVLTGEKPMAQQDEARCRPVGRAQDRGNTVTMQIMKDDSFFHGMG